EARFQLGKSTEMQVRPKMGHGAGTPLGGPEPGRGFCFLFASTRRLPRRGPLPLAAVAPLCPMGKIGVSRALALLQRAGRISGTRGAPVRRSNSRGRAAALGPAQTLDNARPRSLSWRGSKPPG